MAGPLTPEVPHGYVDHCTDPAAPRSLSFEFQPAGNCRIVESKQMTQPACRRVAYPCSGGIHAVEQEEDHHLYHTKGFTRELWIASLGLPAVLPPPEEVKMVETAIGASRAEHLRDDMLVAKH